MCKTHSLDERKKPAMVVTILSILVTIGGLVMLIMAIAFLAGKESILDADLGDINILTTAFKGGVGAALLIVSLIALTLGIAGSMCSCQFCAKDGCCAKCMVVTYGIGLNGTWLAYLIVGSILTSVSTSGIEQIQSFCDGDIEQTQVEQMSDAIEAVDALVNSYAGSFMCSNACPCQTSDVQPWLDTLSADDFASFNRTTAAAPNKQTLQEASTEYYYFVHQASFGANEVKYTNFQQCHEKLAAEVEAQLAQDPSAAEQEGMPSASALEMGMKVIAFFEGKYKCSGMCNPGLFYYSLDLSEGVPSDGCLQHLKTEIGDTMTYIGVTAIIIGILMCFVFVAQYWLWCDYK